MTHTSTTIHACQTPTPHPLLHCFAAVAAHALLLHCPLLSTLPCSTSHPCSSQTLLLLLLCTFALLHSCTPTMLLILHTSNLLLLPLHRPAYL